MNTEENTNNVWDPESWISTLEMTEQDNFAKYLVNQSYYLIYKELRIEHLSLIPGCN
ncbi:hypothetical protein F9C07_3718 [Aspergillus flavus]|uniref:Uncharacterized protein n=1 Tax=Aspergillus flavus (strain ATCC 200026 / FGSC A1120 / IAM 13836 / NRRL 3357 / JCM 12722 / SRRC 167) TaxID=332952 RepID=A0A7U2QYU4_ASPFN|nr:hypothetical protein F9C07_3718 [Aspergillus flavus]